MDSEGRIKHIVLGRMERCVVCHNHFKADDITVISRERDMWTMLVECTDCHARNFVAAVMNDGNPEDAQLALRRLSERAHQDRGTDTGAIEAGDTIEAAEDKRSPVNAADVVDIHEFLADFDGDFKELFDS
jgi:hypothetical protein